MEEVNELFVPENKLNLALADANTLPTISITKVIHHSSASASRIVCFLLSVISNSQSLNLTLSHDLSSH